METEVHKAAGKFGESYYATLCGKKGWSHNVTWNDELVTCEQCSRRSKE